MTSILVILWYFILGTIGVALYAILATALCSIITWPASYIYRRWIASDDVRKSLSQDELFSIVCCVVALIWFFHGVYSIIVEKDRLSPPGWIHYGFADVFSPPVRKKLEEAPTVSKEFKLVGVGGVGNPTVTLRSVEDPSTVITTNLGGPCPYFTQKHLGRTFTIPTQHAVDSNGVSWYTFPDIGNYLCVIISD